MAVRAAICARIAALLLAVMVVAQPAAAQSGLIARTLEKQLSTEDRIVQITGFSGALSSAATIDELSVSDRDGIWLRLVDVVIDWNRSALLRGRVEVTKLSAARIEIPRGPGQATTPAAPAAQATPFSLPDLPVSIRIDEVSADHVILGEPLFGVAADLSVAGSLKLADGEGEGKIEATRLDGPGGLFRIAASYSNASKALTVDTRIEEPQGGVIANAIGLPGAPAIDLEVTGSGPISDFAADIRLATDNSERIAGTFRLTGDTDTGQSFAADLGGDVAPLFLPGYQDFFGPDVRLVVEGSRSAAGELRLPQLSLTAAQVQLDGSVVIGADGLPDIIDLQGQIADASGAPVLLPVPGQETRVGRAELKVAFDASQGDGWTGRILAQGLDRPGLKADRIELSGAGTITSAPAPRVTARLDLVAAALDLGSAEARQALGQTVTAATDLVWERGSPVELTDLTVSGETYGLDGRATIASEGGTSVRFDVNAEARDLSAFAGIAGRPLSGRIDTSLAGLYQPLSGLFDITLDGTGRDVAVGIAEVDTLLAGEAQIALAARRDASGTHLRSFSVTSDGVTATGEASITETLVAATLDATLVRADVIAPDVRGPIEAHLRATGPRDDVYVIADVTGPDLELHADAAVSPEGEAMRIAGSVAAKVADLAPFSGRAGRPLSGGIDLAAQRLGRHRSQRLRRRGRGHDDRPLDRHRAARRAAGRPHHARRRRSARRRHGARAAPEVRERRARCGRHRPGAGG